MSPDEPSCGGKCLWIETTGVQSALFREDVNTECAFP